MPERHYMKYIYLALNWTFGILFLLLGFAVMLSVLPAGIALLAVSLLLLPPVRNFAHSATRETIPFKARAVVISILLVVFGFYVAQEESRRSQKREVAKEAQIQAQIAAAQQQDIDYFNQNAVLILAQVREMIADSKYKDAIVLSSEYLASNNTELVALNTEAKEAQAMIDRESIRQSVLAERKEKTQAILAQLQTTPASDLPKSQYLYQQLVSLNPDVPEYANKLKTFSERLKQQQEKERLAQEKINKENDRKLAAFGKPPERSRWDGSYLPVEQHLKRIANDPDSIKIDGCTDVYTTKEGWLVGCDYRGRNAFGGMIRQSNWFTIVHGFVVKMHDASAFKL